MHEVTWQGDGNSWTKGFTFPDSNGNAGIWVTAVNSLTYVYVLNSAGDMQLWWKDFNTTVNSTQHPVGVWNKGMYIINQALQPFERNLTPPTGPKTGGSIRSNSSVAVDGPQGSGFVQLSDDTFTLIGVTQNAQSSTLANSQSQSGFVSGVPNSRVAVYTPLLKHHSYDLCALSDERERYYTVRPHPASRLLGANGGARFLDGLTNAKGWDGMCMIPELCLYLLGIAALSIRRRKYIPHTFKNIYTLTSHSQPYDVAIPCKVCCIGCFPN